MQRTSVSSSDLQSVGYESGTLEIRFHNGGTYQYFGVPESVYRSLMSAASKGSYFQNYIRGHYQYARV
jgi:hypothetical protein